MATTSGGGSPGGGRPQQPSSAASASPSSAYGNSTHYPSSAFASSPSSGAAAGSGPESLITQVQPPSNNPITSVAPPSNDESNFPAGIITQVAPPTAGAAAAPKPRPVITQPSNSANMNTAPATNASRHSLSRNNGNGGGFLSRLFCCCGPPSSSGKVDRGDHELTPTAKGGGVGGAGYEQKAGQGAGSPKPAIVKTAAASPTGAVKRPGDKKWLLKPLAPEDIGKKCLVLDLDETLVHSSFKAVPNADFIIPVEIDAQVHNVYVLKRPGVDVFLQRLGRQFEVVVFTASLAKYADPVLDMLDKHRVVKHRLFRESCLHHKGNYVKDLSQLGRDLKDVIILDNSPASYIFHPTNAIPISSWFNDPNDTELLDLIPFLEDLKLVDNVMTVLSNDASD
ncbi:hypothetical protein HDU96_005693 [Phlyctochytrium bullatum]|nr:hypothetical protein HDU96_005693 [Phlyctochytrium bullatum]